MKIDNKDKNFINIINSFEKCVKESKVEGKLYIILPSIPIIDNYIYNVLFYDFLEEYDFNEDLDSFFEKKLRDITEIQKKFKERYNFVF